jgi:hypothetical protein
LLINTQKLFTANLAIKLTIVLLGEEIIDTVSTQLILASGGYEGNPLLATQFNQTHSVIQFSLIGKFVFPLLLFPAIYFIFFKINDTAKWGRFVHRFLVASIIAANISYIIILFWNVSFLLKI